jgi:hypothetical protein
MTTPSFPYFASSIALASLTLTLAAACASSPSISSGHDDGPPATVASVQQSNTPPSIDFPCGDLEIACSPKAWACGTDGVLAQHCFASPPPPSRHCCGQAQDPPPCTPIANPCANDDACNGRQKCGRVSDGCGGFVQCGGCMEPGYVCGAANRCRFDHCAPDCGSCPDGLLCSLVQDSDGCVSCGCN